MLWLPIIRSRSAWSQDPHSWFDNVEKGIKKAATDLGVNAWMICPYLG
jgi:hypothetical protein